MRYTFNYILNILMALGERKDKKVETSSTKQTSKQNITRDIEIKNKLTVTRVEG